VKLSKDGKDIYSFNKVHVGLDEKDLDFDMRKEQAISAKAQGKTPEELAKEKADAEKAVKEHNTLATLNEKLKAAGASIDGGDYETAIATLNDANQIDSSRDPIWALLGDAYRLSGPKQTDPAEKQKRYELAIASYQKAIDLRGASEQAKKDPNNNQKTAADYNNLADACAKSNKTEDAVANYNKAIELDPAHQSMYLFNEGAVFTNSGKVDEAIAAFDKVIAADPTRATAYYWKGVNLLAKATLQGDKMVAPDGTAEAFQKYLELAPTGQFADAAKGMLASIGATVETGFGTKKKPPKK
jgi:tetratricopeptide (TPR) repeat protein